MAPLRIAQAALVALLLLLCSEVQCRVVKVSVGSKSGALAFKPATVRLKAGDSIKFVMAASPPTRHTVKFSAKPGITKKYNRLSPFTKSGQSFKTPPFKRGKYPFVCTIHAPSMKGTVIVT